MRTSEEIIDILKNKRIEKDLSQRDLAKLTGLNNSTISRYESYHREFPINDLPKFCKALNLDLGEVLGIKSTLSSNAQEEDEILTYRYIESPVAAGKPTEVEGQTYQTIAIPSHLLGKYAANTNIIIMKISGESMNKIIPNGSLIGILPYESTWDIKDGDIVVFTDENFNYSVKRYYKQGSRIVFRPESTDTTYIDIIYNLDEETVEIIGKVIMYNVIL